MFPQVGGLLSDLPSSFAINRKIVNVIVFTGGNAGYFPFIPVDYGPGATPRPVIDHAVRHGSRRGAAACAQISAVTRAPGRRIQTRSWPPGERPRSRLNLCQRRSD
ncbi:hypothetical protein Aple_078670 [Acrocarpospora pleiomorpha]|uniref:Uncharacterized protein n=1 Tax=Acrocarpospora pleiomorpha TaxID=90975 RepID=A0A5M3Y2I0_9ACTN|nr:hypothetical protein Aple_078670 [Acrocarpospora pleiomorpha]